MVLIKSSTACSGYAGVYPYNRRGKYYAKYRGKHLGVYATAREAAYSYALANALAKKDAAKDQKAKLEAELAELNLQIGELQVAEAEAEGEDGD